MRGRIILGKVGCILGLWLASAATVPAMEGTAGLLPLVFEYREETASFVGRAPGFAMVLQNGGMRLLAHTGPGATDTAVSMSLVGANASSYPRGVGCLEATSNYYIGRSESQWKRGIPLYERVRFEGVYPGIDVEYYAADGLLEYDFIVAPHADPGLIAFSFVGAESLEIQPDGALLVTAHGAGITLRKPILFQDTGGVRSPVSGQFRIEDDIVRFHVGDYDRARTLIIDPIVVYGTYLGGTGLTELRDMFIDGQTMYVTGNTTAIDLVADGTSLTGGVDGFAAAIDTTLTGPASLRSLAYFGGSGTEEIEAIGRVRATELGILIAGATSSPDFPVTNFGQLSGALNGARDGFIINFRQGFANAPQMSAYVGGAGLDAVKGLSSDFNQFALTGVTTSADFPVVGANPITNAQVPGLVQDVFVLNAAYTGSQSLPAPPNILFSGFIGARDAQGLDVVIDPANNSEVYVAGTTGENFPVTPDAAQASHGGNGDAFMMRVTVSAASISDRIVYATYLGGTGADAGLTISKSTAPAVYVGGRAGAGDFPFALIDVARPFSGGAGDGFIVRYTGINADFIYYVGGGALDVVNDVFLSNDDNLFVTGRTRSDAISFGLIDSLTTPLQTELNPGTGGSQAVSDAFILRLDASVPANDPDFMEFGSFYGGNQDDVGLAIDAPLGDQHIYVVGTTASNNLVITEGVQEQPLGTQNGFAIRINTEREVVHVRADSTATTPDGATWETAYRSLAEAVVGAAADSEFWIARGLYKDEDITLPLNAALYGGFAGTETSRADRDWVANRTIFDETGAKGGDPDPETIDLNGINLIDGLIFQNNLSTAIGAAIYSFGDSSIIRHCLFRGNTARQGGAIGLEGAGTHLIANCVFDDNSGAGINSLGGALYTNSTGLVRIANCTFYNNTAVQGQSIYTNQGNPNALQIANSIFSPDLSPNAHIVHADINPLAANFRNNIVQGGYAGPSQALITDDPNLVDPAAGDFRLGSPSPARGTGYAEIFTQLGITTDFEGDPRSIRGDCEMDIGAYAAAVDPPKITLAILTDPHLQEVNTPYVEPSFNAVDACNEDITTRVVATSPNVASLGLQSITYTVRDAEGRSGSAQRNVQVVDTTPPAITLNGGNVVLECGDNYSDAGATATDNFDPAASLNVVVNNPVDASLPGVYIVRYNVQDAAGNEAGEVTRTVEVVDTIAPVITLNLPLVVEVARNYPFVDPGATAIDACDPDVSDNIIVNGDVDTATVGTYFLDYDVQDSEGNAAGTETRTVNVVAGAAPVITPIGGLNITIECGADFVDPGATAFDAEDGDISAQIIPVSTVDPNVIGAYTITYDVTDISGNVAATVVRNVAVEDTTAPVLTLNTGPATVECGNGYVDPGAIATDNCDGNLGLVVGVGVVDTNTPGPYTLTYDINDAAGNPALQVTRTVTVVDTTAPQVTPNGATNIVVQCGDSYLDQGGSALDACDDALAVTIAGETVNTAVPDVYTVILQATDAAGNVGQALRTVTVQDTAAPAIALNGAATVNIECGDPYFEASIDVDDDCANDAEITIETSGVVDTGTPGDYTIQYFAEDPSGNRAGPLTRTITVTDSAPPLITLVGPALLNHDCGTPFVDPGASAFDACEEDMGVVTATGQVDADNPGDYLLQYDITDSNGNVANQVIRTVRVVDLTPPEITLTGATSLTVQCGEPFDDPGFTATDACGGDLSAQVTVVSTVDAGFVGAYSITYDVSDDAGNAAVQIVRDVIVEDTNGPAITLTGAPLLTLECGDAYVEPGATALDSCEGAIAPIQIVSNVDVNSPGTYSVRYNATDSRGNDAVEVLRTVVVQDTGRPVVTLLGDAAITLGCGQAFSDPGATASDDCEGSLTDDVFVVGAVDISTPGTYTLRYRVQDPSGNPGIQAVRQVTVNDAADPVISLVGAATVQVECGTAFVDPGANAVDTCDSDVQVTVDSTSLDTSTPGDYPVVYSAIDDAGNADSVTRTVQVRDTAAPIITLSGSATVTLNCGGTYSDAGATANDACDGAVTVSVDNPVDSGTAGTYVVAYTAQDAQGNTAAVVTRTVIIQDVVAPILTVSGASPIVVECGEPLDNNEFSAFDACEGDITDSVQLGGDVDISRPADYVRTYNVQDSSGNAAAQQQRTFQVRDTTGPAITLNGENPLAVNCGANYTEPGAVAVDLCSGNRTVLVSGSVNTALPGNYTITYRSVDAFGNESTATRTVNVLAAGCEGEGEGEGEGDGEGEGEGNNACQAECDGITSPDLDGDGLTACEEACYGSSDSSPDTDGDGVSDDFEARYYPQLEPAIADAGEDPDRDNLTNLEEFLEDSSPVDPNSQSRVFYVSRVRGVNQPARGTFAAPWASIIYALSQVNASTVNPARIVVEAGTYTESFALKPGITIVGAMNEEVIVVGSVAAANNSALLDLTLMQGTSSNPLLSCTNVRIRVAGVVFQGSEQRDAVGLRTVGNNGSGIVIDGCVFSSLSIGLEMTGGVPTVRRSVFDDCAITGALLHCDDKLSGDSEKSLGDLLDPSTGLNTFLLTIDGPAVINECPDAIFVERNDWDLEVPTDETVDARIDGPAEFAGFLPKGSGILASSLFCTLWDRDTQQRIVNATVTLAPSGFRPVTVNENGTYPFAAIAPDRYDVTVTAPGYDSDEKTVELGAGELKSIHFPLRRTAAEGEGEGNAEGEGSPEGEGEGEKEQGGGCGCGDGQAAPGADRANAIVMASAFGFLMACHLVIARRRRPARPQSF